MADRIVLCCSLLLSDLGKASLCFNSWALHLLQSVLVNTRGALWIMLWAGHSRNPGARHVYSPRVWSGPLRGGVARSPSAGLRVWGYRVCPEQLGWTCLTTGTSVLEAFPCLARAGIAPIKLLAVVIPRAPRTLGTGRVCGSNMGRAWIGSGNDRRLIAVACPLRCPIAESTGLGSWAAERWWALREEVDGLLLRTFTLQELWKEKSRNVSPKCMA